MKTMLFLNHRGQSLIQVLISLGLMGILASALMTMMSIQMKETRALTQKVASLDLEKLLIASLANGKVCKYVLNFNGVGSAAPLTFDASPGGLPQTITLPQDRPLYAAVNEGIPIGTWPIAAKTGELGSPSSTSLKIRSIQLRVNSGSNGRYLGDWVVNWDENSLVRSILPLSVSTNLKVDDTTNPSAAKILDCQGIGAGLGPYTAPTYVYLGGLNMAWVQLPLGSYPTAIGQLGPVTYSDPITFTPRGDFADFEVHQGYRIRSYQDGAGGISLKTHLEVKREGTTIFSVDLSAHAASAVFTLDYSSSESTNMRRIAVTPNVVHTVRVGFRAACSWNPCTGSGKVDLFYYTPAAIGIQEYY